MLDTLQTPWRQNQGIGVYVAVLKMLEPLTLSTLKLVGFEWPIISTPLSAEIF